MCLAGCDALYEKGYVTVALGGTIQRGRLDVTSPDLETAIGSLIGRTCSSWTTTSERYFQWHRTEVLG